MFCPYCNQEMRKGFMPTYKTRLMWIPEGGRIPMTVFGKPKNGVTLSDIPFWAYERVESYYCEQCKMILTPVKENEN